MDFGNIRKIIIAVGLFFVGWLALRWCLPVMLPFLIGSAVALAAEPAVKLCAEKGKLPRVWTPIFASLTPIPSSTAPILSIFLCPMKGCST